MKSNTSLPQNSMLYPFFYQFRNAKNGIFAGYDSPGVRFGDANLFDSSISL